MSLRTSCPPYIPPPPPSFLSIPSSSRDPREFELWRLQFLFLTRISLVIYFDDGPPCRKALWNWAFSCFFFLCVFLLRDSIFGPRARFLGEAEKHAMEGRGVDQRRKDGAINYGPFIPLLERSCRGVDRAMLCFIWKTCRTHRCLCPFSIRLVCQHRYFSKRRL